MRLNMQANPAEQHGPISMRDAIDRVHDHFITFDNPGGMRYGHEAAGTYISPDGDPCAITIFFTLSEMKLMEISPHLNTLTVQHLMRQGVPKALLHLQPDFVMGLQAAHDKAFLTHAVRGTPEWRIQRTKLHENLKRLELHYKDHPQYRDGRAAREWAWAIPSYEPVAPLPLTTTTLGGAPPQMPENLKAALDALLEAKQKVQPGGTGSAGSGLLGYLTSTYENYTHEHGSSWKSHKALWGTSPTLAFPDPFDVPQHDMLNQEFDAIMLGFNNQYKMNVQFEATFVAPLASTEQPQPVPEITIPEPTELDPTPVYAPTPA